MVNQTLLELHMGHNHFGDDGITAIAGSLSNSSITILDVMGCGISFVGVKSLAATLSSNHIRRLWLWYNPITVDGARLVMRSAVDNVVCEYVHMDNEYEDDDEEVKRMRSIMDDRSIQDISYKAGSSKDDDNFEEKSPELPQQQAGDTTGSTTLRSNSENKRKHHIS